MELHIRAVDEADIPAVVELSLLAWEPVFASFLNVLGPDIYGVIWPDWRTSQAEGVTKICRDVEGHTTGVAVVDGAVVGFVTYTLDAKERTGEVDYLAVHPAHQNQGIGTALNAWALAEMKAHGMVLAVVGTGGDAGHAPARRAYEKAGYTPLPLVRYYQYLGEE